MSSTEAAPAAAAAAAKQQQQQQQAGTGDGEGSNPVVDTTPTPLPREVNIWEGQGAITVNRGEVPFVVGGYEFFAEIKGKDLAQRLLSPDPLAYADRWLRDARRGFQERSAEPEWDAFLTNGGLCGGRRLRWALMELPAHRTFKLHCHPVLEVVHIIRGVLYERRMQGPPLDLSGDDGKEVSDMTPLDLSAEAREFRDGTFPEDCVNVNEMGSVHQSWTEAEGCLLLCIWAGHLNIGDGCAPRGYACGGSACLQLVEEDDGKDKDKEA